MMDFDSLRAWIGRSETRADRATAMPIAALAATLDRDDPVPAAGSEVPPLWHWLYFTPLARASELGHDGHARLGGFLPPVPLPRRMWAGGRLEFAHPLRVGDEMTRSSRIAEVSGKSGRSGALVFVTVQHAIANAFGVALREEHDIVYREAPRADAPLQPPQAAPRDEAFGREIVPDPVLLFRYSALTSNGHRIHYDRDYARNEEGYRDLVVHGPLLATFLQDLARTARPAVRMRHFSFRGLAPVFVDGAFHVEARTGEQENELALWIRDAAGGQAMQATAVFD